ncbi:MAG: hypothetical protein ACE5E0_01610 [Terriglobia bacterium]
MNKRKQVRVLVAHADTLMTRLISDIIGLEGHTSVLAAAPKRPSPILIEQSLTC